MHHDNKASGNMTKHGISFGRKPRINKIKPASWRTCSRPAREVKQPCASFFVFSLVWDDGLGGELLGCSSKSQAMLFVL